jgi:hypothetical protein
MLRKLWRVGVLGFVAVMITRAALDQDSGVEDTAAPLPPTGEVVLRADGDESTTVEFAIERLNVYLVEDESYPESFEFAGESITLVGKFPLSLHVGYDENWGVLVGKPIPFARSHDLDDASSQIHFAGETPCPVTSGAFTIHEVGANEDAKTPLRGELWLRCTTPEGERVLRGTFNVKGTTWG